MDENKLYSLWMDECGNDTTSFDEFKKIFTLGRQFGISQGRMEDLEEVAWIANEWAMEYVDVDHAPVTVGDYIRQRIKDGNENSSRY